MVGEESQFVRVQENGQVTLPAEIRRRLGLKKGDLVAVVETAGGVLLFPSGATGAKVLEQSQKTLEQQGISLEELLAEEPSDSDVPLRDFTPGEIATFIDDDRLTNETRAVIRRFGRVRSR